MQIEALKNQQYKYQNTQNNSNKTINKTLEGVLINNHVKNSDNNKYSFDDIQDNLLIIATNNKNNSLGSQTENSQESSFDVKKALKPLLIGTGVIVGGCFALSTILKHSSKNLLNSKSFEQLPDLAVNMNIKEEPQFAIYRAIRDPNYKNILAAGAVFLMSGITIACKNFVDGTKEIWLKKQSCDVEKNLQENLIEVETSAFSGKLQIVNELMNNNIKYFDEVLNKENTQTKNIFSGFKTQNYLSFKSQENKTNDNSVQKKKNIKYALLTAGVLIASIALGKFSISNLKKTAENTSKFANNYTENTINAIKKISQKADEKDIPLITELFKAICAKPEFVKETCSKYQLKDKAIKTIIEEVNQSKKTIFADAPTALGGIPKKIQYYCYIDENRGHLYNWILNPENKFTKYLFGAFTLSSAIGYVFKQGMDALKEVTVMKENAKSELDLRKQLVDVEVRNFKSKKESAITPLVANFKKQVQEGKKSKEELKQIADNILIETKNGPPYVYT